MTQQLIVLVLFLIAAGYIGWRIYKAFDNSSSGGCAKGCGCTTDKAMSAK